MKRTTVFADENDLAILKAAAQRQGVAEAALLREAIHCAAMARRTWSEPFFTHTYTPEGESSPDRADDVAEAAWVEQADAYERTKSSTR